MSSLLRVVGLLIGLAAVAKYALLVLLVMVVGIVVVVVGGGCYVCLRLF